MLLLDTNVVLWLAREPGRVTPEAREAIRAARRESSGLYVASVTLFEIALLAAKGKLVFHTPVELLLQSIEATYRVLPLNWKIAAQAAALSKAYPKDPADRQIGATGLVQGLTLVTADKPIRASGEVPCLW